MSSNRYDEKELSTLSGATDMAKKPQPSKAFSYLRVSGQSQLEGDGFPRQRETIARYAASHRIEVVDEFSEDITGKTELVEERPALQALVERIMANGVRTILVERSDRWARDLIAGELLLRQMRKLGVRVICCDAGIDLTADDTDDPSRKLIRQVLGAVAEFQKSELVLKLKVARARKRKAWKEGKGPQCDGRKPYGFHADEAKVVDRMKDLARKPRGGARLPLQSVADQLNDEGFRNRSGGEWTKAMVHKILSR
jgi:DNA invertase Pin-like site-specific DNA recombinase